LKRVEGGNKPWTESSGRKSSSNFIPTETTENIIFENEGKNLITEYILFHKGEELFTKKRIEYFGNFLNEDPLIINTLTKGRLLGEDSRGWENLAEHNIVAGVIARKLGELVGLSAEKLKDVTFYAATHDWDKRIDIERAKVGEETEEGGIKNVIWDAKVIMESERSKEGPTRVTGDDVRDYGTWEMTEKIIRFTDSSLMDESGHTKVVSIDDRFDDLIKRMAKKSPGYNKIQGEAIYGKGKLLYDEIKTRSEWAEGEIYAEIHQRHPELTEKYSGPGLLYKLVTEKIVEDIDSILLNS
jgi:hypothetical protein